MLERHSTNVVTSLHPYLWYLLQIERSGSNRAFRRKASSGHIVQLSKYLSTPSVLPYSESQPNSPLLPAARSPPRMSFPLEFYCARSCQHLVALTHA